MKKELIMNATKLLIMKATKLLIICFLALALIIAGTVYYAIDSYHSKVAEMYQFAGENYLTADESQIPYLYESYLQELISEASRPKGDAIDHSMLTKDKLKKAGISESCGGLSYLKLFGSEINSSNYKNSSTCCLPSVTGHMLPLVYDNKRKRALIMCGFGNDAHVISVSRYYFNKIMNEGLEKPIMDIQKSYDEVKREKNSAINT